MEYTVTNTFYYSKMSGLTSIVEEYQDILPLDIYNKLHEAASAVPADQLPSLEASFRTQLHSACEAYTQDLKEITSDIKSAKTNFLKNEEDKDHQNSLIEMRRLGL